MLRHLICSGVILSAFLLSATRADPGAAEHRELTGKVIKAMPGDEFEALALEALTGGLFRSEAFASAWAQREFRRRARALLADLNRDGALRESYCAQRTTRLGDKAGECDYSDYQANKVWTSRYNKEMHVAVIEALASRSTNAALVTNVRTHMVQTMGSIVKGYTWTKSGRINGYLVKQTPPENWSQTDLRYAVEYARRSKLPEHAYASLDRLIEAQPDCRWYLTAVERPYAGKGRYGRIRVGNQVALARSSLDREGGIWCKEVRKVKSHRKALRVARKGHAAPRSVLAAHFLEQYSWEIIYSHGRPMRKTHVIKVYAKGSP